MEGTSVVEDIIEATSKEDETEPIPEELIPKLYMEFQSEQDAYDFYNRYAFRVGFAIRRSWKHNLKNSTELRDRVFCCTRQGVRPKDKRDENAVKYVSAETRCECLARMKIILNNGVYRVYEFKPEHNHQLTTSEQTHRLRSHGNMSNTQLNQVEIARSVGIAPKKIFDMMAKEVGGRENLGFILEDSKNRLRLKRPLKTNPGDTGGVMEYLATKAVEDARFFHSVQPDEDDLITNIFWTDAKMRIDYEDFGDVVCFDTTYRKLNDGRPFGLLVGVNHYKQTIIFGACLLYDEKKESFEWLFRTFLIAMGGKKPQTILTDEDAAMASAIKTVLPEVHHRICVWHMYQNALKHLSGVFKEFKKFSFDFGNCVYEHENEATFVHAWDEMLEKYNLQENEWLDRLFKKREKWALVYGRNTFSAAMSTTQRSESMNKELKSYLNIKNDMLTFFEHFERMVSDRRYEELKADTKATQSNPMLKANIGILLHAASVYTPQVFDLFQKEVLQTWNCNIFYSGEVETNSVFKLQEHGTQLDHTVLFNRLEVKIECTCKKFEFVGILCSHALKVLDLQNVRTIPEIYVLKRWTRKARVKDVNRTCSPTLDPKLEVSNRYKELVRKFIQISSEAAEKEETFNFVSKCGDKLLQDLRQQKNSVDSNSEINPMSNNVIMASDVVQGVTFEPKGIKHKEKSVFRSKRLASGLDKSSKKKKLKTKDAANYHGIHDNISRTIIRGQHISSDSSLHLNAGGSSASGEFGQFL